MVPGTSNDQINYVFWRCFALKNTDYILFVPEMEQIVKSAIGFDIVL